MLTLANRRYRLGQPAQYCRVIALTTARKLRAIEIQPLRNVRSLAFHGRNQNSGE